MRPYDSTLGITDESVNLITIYPNPANEMLNISSELNLDSVEIFSILGQSLMQRSIGSTNAQLDISNLQSGLYIVQITSGTAKAALRFVKN